MSGILFFIFASCHPLMDFAFLTSVFASVVLCHNPPLSGLLDPALPVLNHNQPDHNTKPMEHWCIVTVQTLCRAGPRGRAREWATQGVHPLSWLLSNNRLEEVCGTLTKGTFSSRLLLSNQDKGCTPSVVLPLALPLGPALHNLSTNVMQLLLYDVITTLAICTIVTMLRFYWWDYNSSIWVSPKDSTVMFRYTIKRSASFWSLWPHYFFLLISLATLF